MRDINSLNRVILIGRLGANPEVRYLPQNERAVARFNIATNERFFVQGAENKDRTEWHRIVSWGKLAEFCEKFLTQGMQICVEGKLRTRSWQDREGNKRSTTEVEAQNIIMLSRRDEKESPGPESSSTDRPAAEFPEKEETESGGGEDEDVPF